MRSAGNRNHKAAGRTYVGYEEAGVRNAQNTASAVDMTPHNPCLCPPTSSVIIITGLLHTTECIALSHCRHHANLTLCQDVCAQLPPYVEAVRRHYAP